MPHVELPQTEFKVVVLGDTNVGKTSLVLRFTEGYYRENSRSPTVGAFFLTKRVQTSSGITAKVQIWDTAGQAQFRKMAPIYWRNSAAILLCYDVSNVQSWNVALEWLKELRYDKNVLEKNIVLAMVATKSDLMYSQPHLHDNGNDDSYYSCNNGEDTAGHESLISNEIPEKDKDYHYRQKQKNKGKRMVSFDQVEQILQSFQNQPNIATPTTNASSALGTSSSNAAAANLANHNQYGNGNGHILHMETSARKDENVDLLFQKVAEKVLFVREQERLVYMNHGVKYRHYGTGTSASVMAPTAAFLDNSGGGGSISDFDFMNLQQNGAMVPSVVVGPKNTPTSTMQASNGNGNGNGNPNLAATMSVSDDSNYQQDNHHGSNGAVLSPSSSPQSSSVGKSRQLNFHQYDSANKNTTNNNNNKENQYNNAQPPSSNELLLNNNQRLNKTASEEELNKMRNRGEVNDNISTGLCYGVGCGSTANVEGIDGASSSSTCRIS